MGPKTQRSKGGTQGRGVKMKAGPQTVTSLPDKGSPQKPFDGKVFYLDVTSKLVAEKLERDIKGLGGTVEGFLSKEISYLITNKKEAKCNKSLIYACATPSPEPANDSAHPSSHKGVCQEEGSSKKPEKDNVSRGKSLLKKVMKESKILQKNSILANACNWGVRILHVEEARIYIEQKKRSLRPVKYPNIAVHRAAKRRAKAQKLMSPFIKVEDSSCQYRPLYLVLPLFRSFQPPISKPAQSVDKKVVAAPKGPEAKHSLNKTWHGQEGVNNSHIKQREEKKHGYCECCLQKYDDLDAHLISQQHKNYAQGPHYQDVDDLISSFDFDFVDWAQFRRVKSCSADLLTFSGKQDQKTTNLNDHIPPKSPSDKICASAVVKKTEGHASHDATSSTVKDTTGCELIGPLVDPAQPVCLGTCVMDSSYTQPVLQITAPNNDTVVSPQLTKTGTIFTVYNKDNSQENIGTQESAQRLTERDPCQAAKDIQISLPEPDKSLPLERSKLDDSLCLPPVCPAYQDTAHGAGQPPCGSTLCNKTYPLKLSEPISSQSPGPSKPIRKVKNLERRPRNEEEIPPKLKISIPLERCEWSLPTDPLLSLFKSSGKQSEFCGFSYHSLDISDSMEGLKEQPLSDHQESQCLFSDTTSSASTFNGF